MHSDASAYADQFLRALVAADVRDVVLCPGSRSQAFALSAVRLSREGALDVHVRIDERSAGFLALGLARGTGRPVPVIVTSGTAVANLHPAMLEAHHADVPLIALTADRPAELHGIRANQTTRQSGLFGEAAREVFDVVAGEDATPSADAAAIVSAALGRRSASPTEPGPVQLNVALREPLSGESVSEPLEFAPILAVPRTRFGIEAQPGTVVIAGADAGSDAADLAVELGAPLVAEPSSNARRGPNLVLPQTLTTELADEVRRVVVLGHPTLSRVTTGMLRRNDIETVVVGRRGLDNVPGAVVYGDLEVTTLPGDWERAWVGRWVHRSRQIRAEIEASDTVFADDRGKAALAHAKAPVTRAMLVQALWQHTWPHDRLVLGASRLIRVADQCVPGKAITVHANRGLAGIDGTIATATGIALAHDRAARGGVTRVLVGDLTLLHDVGSLAVPPDEQRPRLQIVVGDDGGGSIFDLLEVAQTADPEDFARAQRTPQSVDIAAVARGFGLEVQRVETRAELERALTAQATSLIHVVLATEQEPTVSP